MDQTDRRIYRNFPSALPNTLLTVNSVNPRDLGSPWVRRVTYVEDHAWTAPILSWNQTREMSVEFPVTWSWKNWTNLGGFNNTRYRSKLFMAKMWVVRITPRVSGKWGGNSTATSVWFVIGSKEPSSWILPHHPPAWGADVPSELLFKHTFCWVKTHSLKANYLRFWKEGTKYADNF